MSARTWVDLFPDRIVSVSLMNGQVITGKVSQVEGADLIVLSHNDVSNIVMMEAIISVSFMEENSEDGASVAKVLADAIKEDRVANSRRIR